LFLVADFFIEGVEFVDLTIAECFAVEDLTIATLSQNGTKSSELGALAGKLHEEMMKTRQQNAEQFSIENFSLLKISQILLKSLIRVI
jgi:hypothetical protein